LKFFRFLIFVFYFTVAANVSGASSAIGIPLLDHDSLLLIIEERDDDSLKVQAIIDFAVDILEDYPDSAFVYLEKARDG